MAKNVGKVFEECIKSSIDKLNIYFYRLKDSTASFAGGNTSFAPQNDYDCFAFYKSTLFPLELKSTKQTSISIQRESGQSGKMIKKSQIDGLLKASEHDGIEAGLLMNFRKTDNTYWLDIFDFKRFFDDSDKMSINEKDIVEYGGIKVGQRLKRVNYEYYMRELFESILER